MSTVKNKDAQYEIEAQESPRWHKKEIPEFEYEGESYKASPVSIPICSTHNRENFLEGRYTDNHDGTVSCKFCPFGAMLGGYYKVLEEKIVDLRSL